LIVYYFVFYEAKDDYENDCYRLISNLLTENLDDKRAGWNWTSAAFHAECSYTKHHECRRLHIEIQQVLGACR